MAMAGAPVDMVSIQYPRMGDICPLTSNSHGPYAVKSLLGGRHLIVVVFVGEPELVEH